MAVAIALGQGPASTLYNLGLGYFLRIPDINCKDLIKLWDRLTCIRSLTGYNSVRLRNYSSEELRSEQLRGAIAPPSR